MPRGTPLNAAAIEKQIAALQKQKDRLQRKNKPPVIAKIKKMMSEYGITLQELGDAKSTGTSKARQTTRVAKKASTVAPKYRHPDTGETWSGRGKAPRWLTTAESAGKDRKSFLIEKPKAEDEA